MNRQDFAQWSYDYRPHQQAYQAYVDDFYNFDTYEQLSYQEMNETQFDTSCVDFQTYQEFHQYQVLCQSHANQYYDDDHENQQEIEELVQCTNEKLVAQDERIDEL